MMLTVCDPELRLAGDARAWTEPAPENPSLDPQPQGRPAEPSAETLLLHQTLGVQAGAGADSEPTLQRLCGMLEAFVVAPRGHTLHFTILDSGDGIALRPDAARCLNLMVSELVINAAKHAFDAGSRGRIDVVVVRTANRLSCIVRDNGSGQAPDGLAGGSQGMKLAQRLAERAGGRCRWVFSGSGTEARIELPVGSRVAPLPTASPMPVRQSRLFGVRTGWSKLRALSRGPLRQPELATSARCEFR
jgi:hypothetical protein